MSILNKEFYLNETTIYWNDWNCQSGLGYANKAPEKVNKSIDGPTTKLAAGTSLAGFTSNPPTNIAASFKETQTDRTCAFGSSTVNSNQTKHPNESDTMTSLGRADLFADNRNDHRKDHPNDSNQASPESNSPDANLFAFGHPQSNERPTDESENIDFTSLHNDDVISLADADAASGQSNCMLKSVPFHFSSPPSSLANPSNLVGPSNLVNSSRSNSSISSSSTSLNSSPLNAHLARPHHFNSSSPQAHSQQLRLASHQTNRSSQQVSFNQPVDTQQSNVDDGLTNLSWLQNLNMNRLGAPTPPASPLCNLVPSYFSGINPQSTSGGQAVYSSQQQYQLSTANKLKQPIKAENGRKPKNCKSNGSKGKPTTNRRMNKPNCQNAVDSSIGISSSCQNGQIIDANHPNRSADYTGLGGSLNLTCNDQSALHSDSYPRNEMAARLNDLSRLNGSSLVDSDSLSREQCDQFAGEIDYDLDDSTKPPFSYAALICMAMKSNQNKMTLREIYQWIREKFIFYRKTPNTWEVRLLRKALRADIWAN